MQKLMKRLHKNQKGFTLVELMVVVVIIGVLVAIAVPIYNAVTARAELAAISANLRTVNGAITSVVATVATPTGGWTTTNLATEVNNYIEGNLADLRPGTYTIQGTSPNFYTRVAVTAGTGGLETAGNYRLTGGNVVAE